MMGVEWGGRGPAEKGWLERWADWLAEPNLDLDRVVLWLVAFLPLYLLWHLVRWWTA